MGKKEQKIVEESGQIVMFDLTPSSTDIKALVKDRMAYFELRQKAREEHRRISNAKRRERAKRTTSPTSIDGFVVCLVCQEMKLPTFKSPSVTAVCCQGCGAVVEVEVEEEGG